MLAITLLLAITSATLIAQNNVVLHGSVGPALILPTGGFTNIADVPAPPDGLDYSPDGTSWQPWISIGADTRITSLIALGGSVAYRPQRMNYVATEQTLIANEGGGTTLATMQHDLSMSYKAVSAEPYARIEPSQWLGLQLGLPVSFPVGTDYVQTQQFTDPPGLTFVDGSAHQTTGSGAIPHTPSVVFGFSFRADAMLPLTADRQWLLTPMLGTVVQLSSWNTEAAVNTLSFEIGVGVRYQLFDSKPIPTKRRDTTYVRDTVTILSSRIKEPTTERISAEARLTETAESINVEIHERYHLKIPKPPAVLKASITLAFEGHDGSITPEAGLRVNKVERTRIVPLLPVVVFDANTIEIPSRYAHITPQSAKRFVERSALVGSSTHWQYSVLNIIGSRLRRSSSSKLTLIGFTDGTIPTDDVAQQRAANIKEYLTTVFGISSKRMSISMQRGGQHQHNWILLSDSSRKLLHPIEATDTTSETLLPTVRIVPEVVTELGVKSWIVRMSQNETNVVASRQGFGDVPSVLKWDMNADISPDRAFDKPIDVVMDVTDHEGGMVRTEAGHITLLGPTATASTTINVIRQLAVTLNVDDLLSTPDSEIVIPSVDYRIFNEPPPNSYWDGLVQPELDLFRIQQASLYKKEERRP